MRKKVLNPNRLRRIDGGFSFIPHRFLTDGFVSALNRKELLLYFFLVLVSDRHGLSFYSYDAICSLLELSLDEYIEARDGLIGKDLIAFDGALFQVLALPSKPLARGAPQGVRHSAQPPHRTRIRELVQQSLQGAEDGR